MSDSRDARQKLEIDDDGRRKMPEENPVIGSNLDRKIAVTGTVGDVASDFMNFQESKQLADSTVTTAERVIGEAVDVWGADTAIYSILQNDVAELLDEWNDHLAPSTNNLYRRHLRQWIRWMTEHEDMNIRLSHRWIPDVREPKRTVDVVSDGDWEKFISAADSERSFCRIRMAAMCRLLLDTGLRQGECRSLEVSHVMDGRIRVLGKGARERFVHPSSAMWGRLTDWMELLGEAVDELGRDVLWLFPTEGGNQMSANTVRRWFNQFSEEVGIDPPIRPHMLRSTWATNCIRQGIPLPTICQMGGWASSQVLEDRYVAAANRDQLEDASEKSMIAGDDGDGNEKKSRIRRRWE